MTSKNDFSEDEWAHVVRAPFVAGLAVSLSDPGGPIEAGKEQMAAIRGAMNPPSREELLTDVALDVQGMTQQREHPLKGYPPAGGGDLREALPEELHATRAVIESKATPAEATAFSRWVSTWPKRQPMRPRKMASWGSALRGSVTGSDPCWTGYARR